ncbi:DUF2628 domain-containing protein [Paraburkholderia tropica]|uniref:DUF2628 domain-containing protein n=1 Tax=Paraburkholderia tropica TaxID=92647 RepID=UPI003D2D53C7
MVIQLHSSEVNLAFVWPGALIFLVHAASLKRRTGRINFWRGEMSFCSECGTQLISAAKFCPNCGAKASSPVNVNAPQQDAQTYSSASAKAMGAPSLDRSRAGDDDPVSLFVGKKAATYKKKWQSFDMDPNKKVGWNWAAFFFNAGWFAYRKMWLYALIILGIGVGVEYIIVLQNLHSVIGFVIGLIVMVLSGLFGDFLYKNRCDEEVARINNNSTLKNNAERVARELKSRGGTSKLNAVIWFVGQYLVSLSPIVIVPTQYAAWQTQLKSQIVDTQTSGSSTQAVTTDQSVNQAATPEARVSNPEDIASMLPLAQQGDPIAQNNIGSIYLNGTGVPKDFEKAAYWYSKAAAQHQENAETSLGLMYVQGLGVEKDPEKALALFRDAAGQGNSDAQNDLGIVYENGIGVDQDLDQAAQWFRKSADAGNQSAAASLTKIEETMKAQQNSDSGNQDEQSEKNSEGDQPGHDDSSNQNSSSNSSNQ